MGLASLGRSETGTLPGEHSFAKVGGGPRALVVLPGFGDAMFSGRYPPGAGWALAPYFAPYLDRHTVYLLSRPRGLPSGYDADETVRTHVAALEAVAEERVAVDLLGISMGGLIGQEIARRRPDLVDRLVVANSACRLHEAARPAVRYLERLAHRHDWASIRSELARAMFTDLRAVTYPLVLQTVGRFVQPHPADPADVWRSLAFILAYDGCGRLREIDRPTLVFGGDRDPYFTADVARETAAGIPDAELSLVRGGKHGAFHERKATFDARVRAFLRVPRRSGSGTDAVAGTD